MKRDRDLILVAAVAAAALLYTRRAAASQLDPHGEVIGWDWGNGEVSTDPWPDTEGEPMTPDYLSAFLHMIKSAETDPYRAADGRAYFTLFGNGQFTDTRDHPALLGWPGVRLSDQMCRNAGFGPGCVSTAAGAYQIIRPTWDRVRKSGAWGLRLPDFSPESQDEAARRILIMIGALPYVEGGEFDAALRMAATQWASLPGSTAKQGPKSYEQVLAFYSNALGVA